MAESDTENGRERVKPIDLLWIVCNHLAVYVRTVLM